MKEDFLPVILGTDWNVYGVASSFYQAYGKRSVAFGIRHQAYTNDLDFLEVYVTDNFTKDEVFVSVLVEFAKKNNDKRLLLISCSDYYSGLVIRNKAVLSDYYLLNYIDEDLRNRLENKMDFYKVCEEYGLPFPNTVIVNEDDYKTTNIPFKYPIILKPNDSFKWVKIKFSGYKKAYLVNTHEEMVDILDKAYNNGYDDYFIIQDFIPGGPEAMFVVNAYADKNGRVVMTHGAQTALDEVLPNDIGNYNALISGEYIQLTRSVKEFLEKIGYVGYANFDFKYDRRDGIYKVFEVNIRQGRSSFFMTYAGNNFVTYLVDDLINNKELDYYNHTKEHVWYITAKSVLKKYAPEELKPKINRLLNEGKADYGLSFYADKNIKRWWYAVKRKLSTIKYYPKLTR